MRIDKFLANNGIGTRSEVKKLLKSGAVLLDGTAIKDAATQFDPAVQVVTVAGRVISYKEHYYYMLNKPAGVITASRDKNASTVLDLLSPEDKRSDLVAVGRLDKDTVGLLLITDDGELNHRLTSPRHHVDKIYLAILDKAISPDDISMMESGIDIGDDEPTLPCRCVAADKACLPERFADSDKAYLMTIHEGRYHQVKRMFSHFGSEVIYLKRLAMGALRLDENLGEGEYRELTDEELRLLGRE